MVLKDIHLFVIFTLLSYFSISSEAFSAEIEWNIFLKYHMNSSPILSKKTGVGEEFIVQNSEFTEVPLESQDLINALDGIRFQIQQSPSSSPVSIHIVLNASGNTFELVSVIPLFINLTFETYINGQKEDNITFNEHSPMVITIPQSTLNALLGTCGLSRNYNLMCVFYSGGSFTNEGIKTDNTTSGMKVTLNRLGDIVGGMGEKLGFPSDVRIDTWSKIKLLFR